MLSHQKCLLDGSQGILFQIFSHGRAVLIALIRQCVERQGILLAQHGTHGLIIACHGCLLIAQHEVCLSKIYFFIVDHQRCLGSVHNGAVPAGGESGRSHRSGKHSADDLCTCSFHIYLFTSRTALYRYFFACSCMTFESIIPFFAGEGNFFHKIFKLWGRNRARRMCGCGGRL